MRYLLLFVLLIFAKTSMAEEITLPSGANETVVKSEYFYNDQGQLEKIIFNDSTVRVYEYDENGHRILTKMYDADGVLYGQYNVQETYDDNGLLVTRKHLCENCADYVYEYDNNGKLTKEYNKGELVAAYEYDEKGRKKSYTNKQGNVYTYKYDKYGNEIGIYDTSGNLYRSSHWSEGYIDKQRKRIYTISEAEKASGEKNTVMIRYK